MKKQFANSLMAMLFFVASMVPNLASAHFPWLMVDDEGKPVLFFGEDLSDRTYHLPKNLVAFPLKQHTNASDEATVLKLNSVESETLVGLVAAEAVKPNGCIFGTETYGNYRGTKLVYFVQHCLGDDPNAWQGPPNDVALQAKLQPQGDVVHVTVLWNQKPLVDAEVKLSCAEGHEEGSAKTDANGSVTFTGEQLEKGLNALMVGFTDKDASGTFDGTAFASTSNYLTATFNWKSAAKPTADSVKSSNSTEVEVVGSQFPDLPTELTSFGGAIASEKLYVYGGHIGEAHSYSTAEQSDTLYSLDLKNPKSWDRLPSGPRLQGLAMVASGKSVIRLGGFTAMNAEGEEHTLQSQSSVAQYDPANQTWSELTSLPEPRSSHAATVVDGTAYVIGGWAMASDAETQWHQTAWSADLSEQPIVWKEIATPPFARRALAVAAHGGKIYAIGGMGEEGGPTTRVDVYDPKSNQWSEGPSLNGEPMTGFGCWAEPLGNSLYVSTVSGTIQRLSKNGDEWLIVGNYEPGRFFHCMLRLDDQNMVMVGGANMSVGRFTNLDLVHVKPVSPSLVGAQ